MYKTYDHPNHGGSQSGHRSGGSSTHAILVCSKTEGQHYGWKTGCGLQDGQIIGAHIVYDAQAVSEAAAAYEKAAVQNSISFEELKELLQAYPAENTEELPAEGQTDQEETETLPENVETGESAEEGETVLTPEETAAESEESEAGPGTEAETGTEPEAEAGTGTEAEAGTEPETEAGTGTEAEAGTEPESEPESVTETEAEPGPGGAGNEAQASDSGLEENGTAQAAETENGKSAEKAAKTAEAETAVGSVSVQQE